MGNLVVLGLSLIQVGSSLFLGLGVEVSGRDVENPRFGVTTFFVLAAFFQCHERFTFFFLFIYLT